jgi:hypothetical protein
MNLKYDGRLWTEFMFGQVADLCDHNNGLPAYIKCEKLLDSRATSNVSRGRVFGIVNN